MHLLNEKIRYNLKNGYSVGSLENCLHSYIKFLSGENIRFWAICGLSSISFSAVMDRDFNYIKISALKEFSDISARNVLNGFGFSFDIIKKFGGVYGEHYFMDRITQNILMGEPTAVYICDSWYFVAGINITQNSIYIIPWDKPQCLEVVNNWYQKINKMLIIKINNKDFNYDKICLKVLTDIQGSFGRAYIGGKYMNLKVFDELENTMDLNKARNFLDRFLPDRQYLLKLFNCGEK